MSDLICFFALYHGYPFIYSSSKAAYSLGRSWRNWQCPENPFRHIGKILFKQSNNLFRIWFFGSAPEPYSGSCVLQIFGNLIRIDFPADGAAGIIRDIRIEHLNDAAVPPAHQTINYNSGKILAVTDSCDSHGEYQVVKAAKEPHVHTKCGIEKRLLKRSGRTWSKPCFFANSALGH